MHAVQACHWAPSPAMLLELLIESTPYAVPRHGAFPWLLRTILTCKHLMVGTADIASRETKMLSPASFLGCGQHSEYQMSESCCCMKSCILNARKDQGRLLSLASYASVIFWVRTSVYVRTCYTLGLCFCVKTLTKGLFGLWVTVHPFAYRL